MTITADTDRPSLPVATVLRIFVPFAFAYSLSYLYRVVNAVIAPDLAAEIDLTAADLGMMTSAYFLCFAAFQLPLGILLDRYGPRRTEAFLLVVAAVGALVFAQAETVTGLVVGRGLIGLGVSAGLMAAVTAYARWFPPERLAFVNGLQAAAGGIGAVAGTAPVEAALGWGGWRGLFVALAVLTVISAVVLYATVPRRNEVGSGARLRDQVKGTLGVFRSRIFWAVMPTTVFCQAAFLSIQTLWTGPWLRDVAGFERGDAAATLLLIAVALVAGMIGFGMMSQWLQRRGVSPERFMVVSMVCFCACLAVISFVPVKVATALWLLFGFLGGSVYLPFAIMVSKFPRALAGRVSTALNVMTFSFAFLFQWMIGVIINQWPLDAAGRYAAEGYVAALTGTVILQVVGFAWLAVNWRHVEPGPQARPTI